ncbi:RelA/SpoT domain-containing protein [Hyphomonadaceae bacterium ML37]|nr:RelA/SpoT domain-containing protein [Hyphomonadaceae bacterium ML37]
MSFPEPGFSKGEVDRSGDRFRAGTATEHDEVVLANWRAAHGRVINVFQANLRNRCKEFQYPVGQRLKRFPTIVDKLTRQPEMHLARMNDIAGCRVIFPTIKSLYQFRDQLLKARWSHKLTHDPDRYDYVERPKETGYRGIHLVYSFVPRGRGAEPWRGLRIEIQLRTKAQHVWATGVETGDLLTKGRAKFGEGADAYRRYWLLASEIIARTREGQPSYLAELSSEEIVYHFEALDQQLNIRRLMRSARRSQPKLKAEASTVLIYRADRKLPLTAHSFSHWQDAVKFYNKAEKDLADQADVVLVEADNVKSIRNVFRNYFSNTTDFLRYIDAGINLLK